MPCIQQKDVHLVYNAIIESNLIDSRTSLLNGLPPKYIASLRTGNPPSTELYNWLDDMNNTEQLENGMIPLVILLQNASMLSKSKRTSHLFLKIIQENWTDVEEKVVLLDEKNEGSKKPHLMYLVFVCIAAVTVGSMYIYFKIKQPRVYGKHIYPPKLQRPWSTTEKQSLKISKIIPRNPWTYSYKKKIQPAFAIKRKAQMSFAIENSSKKEVLIESILIKTRTRIPGVASNLRSTGAYIDAPKIHAIVSLPTKSKSFRKADIKRLSPQHIIKLRGQSTNFVGLELYTHRTGVYHLELWLQGYIGAKRFSFPIGKPFFVVFFASQYQKGKPEIFYF